MTRSRKTAISSCERSGAAVMRTVPHALDVRRAGQVRAAGAVRAEKALDQYLAELLPEGHADVATEQAST